MYVRDGVVYICSHIHIFGIVRCSYVPIDNVGKAYSECGKQETESMLKVAQAVKQHNKDAFIKAYTSKQPLPRELEAAPVAVAAPPSRTPSSGGSQSRAALKVDVVHDDEEVCLFLSIRN